MTSARAILRPTEDLGDEFGLAVDQGEQRYAGIGSAVTALLPMLENAAVDVVAVSELGLGEAEPLAQGADLVGGHDRKSSLRYGFACPVCRRQEFLYLSGGGRPHVYRRQEFLYLSGGRPHVSIDYVSRSKQLTLEGLGCVAFAGDQPL